MAWSTRELAELAGTSLRSVRHYHDVGLLPEPERRSNGYKQYGVTHLMRLLRIKRLVDLGFSLVQIAELGDRDEYPEEALRALDAELVAQIERLQTLRADLARILEQRVPTDLPAELAVAGRGQLSEADRNIVAVMGRLLGEEERTIYAALLADDARMPSDDDFEALPADAAESVREDLAERMAEDIRALHVRFPGLRTLGTQTLVGPQRYRQTLDRAVRDVYNAAQRDVLLRLRKFSQEDPPR
jgi:DNA-binding transcriptional MerR regulator